MTSIALVAFATIFLATGCAEPGAARIADPIRKPGTVASEPSFRPMLRGLKDRTPILTYHDAIAVRDASALWFDVTPGELTGQLDWMASRGAKWVSLDQLYAHLTTGARLPDGAVVVTFADNYEGFFLRAAPILRRLQVPVAMFVHTGFVGDTAHGRPKMSWDQLKLLDREGWVTVCSQTVSHPARLDKLSDARLEREMVDSKRELEQKLGHPVRYLAYPNGVHDARVEAAARKAGYLMAFSEGMRPAELSKSILSVDRYVHTRLRQAWRACGRR